MEIPRESYLKDLLERRRNGMIKFITGLSHSGKINLLFKLFYKRLLEKQALDEYLRYGGIPYLSVCESEKQKKQFLLELLQKSYLQEIVGINHIHRVDDLKKTIAFLRFNDWLIFKHAWS